MKVDISALRKFEDTFGPAIAAIPAVIDAVAKSNDMERHIAMKQQELQAVVDEIARAKAEGEEFLKTTQARGDSIIAAADAYAAKQKAEADQIVQSAEDAKKAIEQQMLALSDKRTELANKVKAAEEATKAELMRLTAEHSELTSRMASEIEELEARRAKADKALATLKAKLEA